MAGALYMSGEDQPGPIVRRPQHLNRTTKRSVLDQTIVVLAVITGLTALIYSGWKYIASTMRPVPANKTYTRAQFFTADSLGREFENNELRAEKEFDGAEIAVTGVVDSVSTDILGAPYVSLEAEHLTGVQCCFPNNMKDSLAALSKGQTVFVVGTCKGKTIGIVIVDNCRFVKPVD